MKLSYLKYLEASWTFSKKINLIRGGTFMVDRLFFFCYTAFNFYFWLLVGYSTELGTKNMKISYIAIQNNCKIYPII